MFTRLWALLQLSIALLMGGLRCVRFLLKTPRHTLRASLSAVQKRQTHGAAEAWLEPELPGLHPVRPAFLGQAEPGIQGGAIVIYFTGTGETPRAPLPAYRRLIGALPALSALRHYVLEAPVSRGAYYGSSAFSSRVWELLSPLIAREPGPFVFVGLSRGAIAALDTGARVAEEHGKVAAVLALSPPFKLPQPLPTSVVELGHLEACVERIATYLPEAPTWAQNLTLWIVERVQLLLTALVQAELDMLSREDFAYAAEDIASEGALASSARQVREFRLLLEAPDRDLLHFASRVAAVAARTPRYFASLVWGEADSWAPAKECHARLAEALVAEGTPADRVQLTMLPARGHGLFREQSAPVAPIAALLQGVHEQAEQRDRDRRARTEATQTFEQKLLEVPPRFSHD